MTAPDAPAQQCPFCRKRFGDAKAAMQHAKAKHGVPEARAYRDHLRERLATADDDEPSMAELVVDAIYAYAVGEPVDDDLMAMFGDQIRGEQ